MDDFGQFGQLLSNFKPIWIWIWVWVFQAKKWTRGQISVGLLSQSRFGNLEYTDFWSRFAKYFGLKILYDFFQIFRMLIFLVFVQVWLIQLVSQRNSFHTLMTDTSLNLYLTLIVILSHEIPVAGHSVRPSWSLFCPKNAFSVDDLMETWRLLLTHKNLLRSERIARPHHKTCETDVIYKIWNY